MSSTEVFLRVMVVAPTGADARNASQVLNQAGLRTAAFLQLGEALQHLDEACGVLLLTEEALMPGDEKLTQALARQPPWSDLPIVLIMTATRRAKFDARTIFGGRGNVSLIERPVRVTTLIAAVDAALRARQRQLEVRDLIVGREQLLTSLEERVTERTAKLQAMVEEMEAFSYSVSHDLRSPLRVLAGYAETLCEDHAAELAPAAVQYLKKIRSAAIRMDHLTQDLLAYTRVARGPLVPTVVDLDDLVAEVIESYPKLREANGAIRVQRPLGVVRAHMPSLVQCFSNLLENALKFSSGSRVPVIHVSSQRHNGRVRCFVADNGPGIAPANHQRIFGLFERGPDKSISGTGVGLAIVKRAVARMGGTVGVESQLGQGARFWIELEGEPPT